MNSRHFPDSRSKAVSTISLNDRMLVDAAKSGEQGAFVQLFHRHSTRVLKTAYGITRNMHDAEDAMQETFLNAYLHIGTFDGRAQFSSWLVRIAMNTSLMVLRRKRNHSEISIDSVVDATGVRQWEPIDASVDIETALLDEERDARLRRAIRRLRPGLRHVVDIQRTQDVSLRETARIANISVAAAKSRMMRARKILRKALYGAQLRDPAE
jgi:RNA polymerase sigma factor (sigma-70 family)